MSEDKKPFTVSDRRHFDSEGRSRTEAEGSAEAPKADNADKADAEGQPAGSSRDRARADSPPRPAALAELLVMLQAQGSLLLAGGEDGGPPDLDGARWVIAVLEMLKDKTEGRRTPDEDKVLDTVLYELRLGYVARTRAGGA